MKKLLFATVLLMSVISISYAKPKNKDSKLASSLSSMVNVSTAVTSSNGEFKNTSFNYNGKEVKAYFNTENDDVIGFSIPMSIQDLPQEAMNDIKKKYSDYSVQDLIMFVQKNGHYDFYVALTKPGKPSVAVKIAQNGKARYFSKM